MKKMNQYELNNEKHLNKKIKDNKKKQPTEPL